MAIHIPFPSIEQFHTVIRAVTRHARYVGDDESGEPIYDPAKPIPTLAFEGTIKLHGTNGAVVLDKSTGEIWFQSRERILSLGDDNSGMMASLSDKPLRPILERIPGEGIVALYGEWCGQGIQKGVAVAQLPKMFVVFAARSGETWVSREIVSTLKDAEHRIFNIFDYPTFTVEVDFNYPQLKQNTFVALVEEIERECPVGKAFDVTGLGEGLVWRCVTAGWESNCFWFKTKGEKHSVSKVRKIASVDAGKVASLQAFVEGVVTDAHCQQAINVLRERSLPVDRSSLGEFLRWMFNDIIKEESDSAAASGVDLEKSGSVIANAAKQWFFRNEGSF